MFAVKLATVLWAGAAIYVDPSPPHRWYQLATPGAGGVLLDKKGPPGKGRVRITFTFYTVDHNIPSIRDEVWYSNYDARATDGDVGGWGHQGLVVKKEGENRLRFLGLKRDGWLLPVTRIEMSSPDVPPHMLPKVIASPKKPDA